MLDTLDKVSQSRHLMSTAAHHIYLPLALKMVKSDQIPHATKSHAFKLTWSLAGASRQVPKSYLIGKFTALTGYSVGKEIIANGGFADIRKGTLNGMDVAVKTIRLSQADDVHTVHEVQLQ